ncbi:MAG: glycosyltransferase family 2 protein [Magnetococcales bacterium]|nr:glycosyltransferase family 2 protein [Magnetococcales bacterium]
MLPDKNKLPISVTVITFNEAESLKDCLLSVAFAKDIVVVDSGSGDETVSIAKSMGARVFNNPWPGYGQQKNFALNKAQFDWVLCLDADERVDNTLKKSVVEAINNAEEQYQGYSMARQNHLLGRGLRHGFGYPDYKVRLVNRRYGRWTEPPVHEFIEVDGPVGQLKGDILHFSGENLLEYLEKQNRYTSLQAKIMADKNVSLLPLRIVFNPIFCFFKGYFIKRAFLDGLPGLIHTVFHCFTTFTKYAKLYELRRKNK